MKAAGWTFFLLAAVAVAARYSACPEPERPADWEKDRVYRPPVVRHFRPASGYSATCFEPRWKYDPNGLQIFQNGRLVYDIKGRSRRLYLGEADRGFDTVAKDVDGNGTPDLIVSLELGDWQSETHIVELGTHFRPILTFRSVFPPRFTRDDNGALLVSLRDSTFSGWRYCHADSPYPLVVLRLQGGQLKLAPERMKRQPKQHCGPVERHREIAALTGAMTECLYTGHPDLCLEALSSSPLPTKDKAKFLRDFKTQLRTSPWAAQLADQL